MEILKRTQGTKIMFCGHGLNFFSPLRGTKSKTTHLLSYIFGSTLEGTAKAPAVAQFESEHPKRHQIASGIPSFPGPFPWLGGCQGKGPGKEVVPSGPLGTINRSFSRDVTAF